MKTDEDAWIEHAAQSEDGAFVDVACLSVACAEGHHDDCTDVDGNCCDCNCHLRSSPVVAPSPLA